MSSTHHQLLYHIVFSTKSRRPYLRDTDIRTQVFTDLARLARNRAGFVVEVNGWIDHVHMLVRIPAKISVSQFVGQLKAVSGCRNALRR